PLPAEHELTRMRSQQVERHLAAATQAFEATDYDAAAESCKHVLMLDRSEPRAIALLDRIDAITEERQQQEESRIRSAVDDARRRFAAGDDQAALDALEALPARTFVVDTLEELRTALRKREEQRILKARVEQVLREFDERVG